MKIPPEMTEAEVIEIIHHVTYSLASKFKFGYHETSDMKQAAWVYAIEGLEKYDPERGKLKTFLWTYVHNELFNLKRNKFERYERPCHKCPLNAYDPHKTKSSSGCTAFNNKLDCEDYNRWYQKNSAKKNLMQPITIHSASVKDENENNMKIWTDPFEEIANKEIIDKIDAELPHTYRKLWIKCKTGIKLYADEKRKLYAKIKEILGLPEDE